MIQQTKFLHQLQKGIQLEIIKPQINIELTKSELNSIIAEAMTDPLASNAIKRILNPFLASSFTQFPTFTNITIGDTDTDGITTVVLRQPKQSTTVAKPSAGVIEEESPDYESIDTQPPYEVDYESESPAYVG
jgi:hypothetical protein